MNTRFVAMAVFLATISAIGCSKNSQPPSMNSSAPASSAGGGSMSATSAPPQVAGSDDDAIRAAIKDHLRNNHTINMAAMDVSVDSVSVNGDQAQANAAFHLKQGGTGMTMTYFLERHANGWLVMRSQPSNGQFVHPPMDKVQSGAGTSSATPGMPDVSDFLKSHAPPNSN